MYSISHLHSPSESAARHQDSHKNYRVFGKRQPRFTQRKARIEQCCHIPKPRAELKGVFPHCWLKTLRWDQGLWAAAKSSDEEIYSSCLFYGS